MHFVALSRILDCHQEVQGKEHRHCGLSAHS